MRHLARFFFGGGAIAAAVAATASLALLPGSARAQVTLSATGGAAFATVNVAKSAEPGLKASSLRRYSAGLKLAAPVGDRFLFRLDGGYAQRGTAMEFREDGAPVNVDVKTGHLELASLVGLRFGGSAASLYLLAGPSAAYEFQCDGRVRAEFDGLKIDQEVDCDGEQLDFSRSVDFGAVGVAGVEIGLGALALSLEGLYYMGLADISDAADETLRHRNLGVRAGVGIPIG